MKEVVVHEGPRTELIESPVPTAQAGQVVIKVKVSGSNPKDWKTQWVAKLPINMGDDIAGTIHEVGPDVTGFKAGDRVFAFHQIQAPHGSYAEYAVAWAYTTAHLPSNTSFEEAATIPLAALTASLALYRTLALPQPWSPAESPIPLLIYGGSSAVGAFAIKLAAQSNIHPIIAVAGAGSNYVLTLLDPSKGDAVIDYRPGRAALESGIRKALVNAGGWKQVSHALDVIVEKESSAVCASLLGPGGKLAHVLPLDEGFQMPKDTTAALTMSGDVHGGHGEKPGGRDFGYVMMNAFTRGLETGWFRGHPYEVVSGGLRAVPTILDNLKSGKASAVKYIFRVADTEGL
ncbi:hypothetical protein MMC07_006470 [Pseudocyphellaria aurata]|nr:hypothetical protein [Pseudocyphellaria aurata]